MENPKSYRLNVDTIETLEDVKVIFSGLNLFTQSNVKDFDKLKKYFTEEITQYPEEDDTVEDCPTCQ